MEEKNMGKIANQKIGAVSIIPYDIKIFTDRLSPWLHPSHVERLRKKENPKLTSSASSESTSPKNILWISTDKPTQTQTSF